MKGPSLKKRTAPSALGPLLQAGRGCSQFGQSVGRWSGVGSVAVAFTAALGLDDEEQSEER